MRVLCLIPAMGSAGGAQRVMAHVGSRFADRHEVTLMTWEAPRTPSFFALPASIEIIQSGLLGGKNIVHRAMLILARFGAIRRQVGRLRPDVVLSFMDTMNITAIIGCMGTGTPLVISERIDPQRHRIGRWKSLLRRLLYPMADCCVVQTERVKSYFHRPPRPNLVVIPNPVTIPPQQAQPATPDRDGNFRIVGMGRLEKQKGFDLLLDAFARLAADFPNWNLIIFGEGAERDELEDRIRRQGLGSRVRLPGVTADAASEFAASHLMAFPSRYEGFPNALAEGQAAGLPVIGFRTVSGVEELVIPHTTGLLADLDRGSAGLADRLKELMENPSLRTRLGLQARCHTERWRSEKICQRWEETVTSVAIKNKNETNAPMR
jgi:glycosyltransferase involved in cell wall biosynthesis